jgi:hypothetical protein
MSKGTGEHKNALKNENDFVARPAQGPRRNGGLCDGAATGEQPLDNFLETLAIPGSATPATTIRASTTPAAPGNRPV